MSDTTATPAPKPTQAPVVRSTDSLWAPQTVVGLILLAIGAATVAGLFIRGDQQTISMISGVVVGVAIGNVSAFYFGSSKGSQAKDDAMADKVAAAPAVPVQPATGGTQ